MRLLTWNIRHGGGQRVPAIGAWLARRAPDVVVLTEVRATPPSLQLRAALASRGLIYQCASSSEARVNGVLIASRTPLRREALPAALACDAQRFVIVRCAGLRIVGAYLPATLATIKPCFTRMLGETSRWLSGETLLIGDFNAGHAELDCEVPMSMHHGRHFQQLHLQGWIDGWRAQRGARREYSWASHRGNGFRIDHAFLSPRLAPRLRAAHYNHAVRRAGLSDHSALLLELSDRP